MATLTEQVVVSASEYLTHRRPLPHLYELTPDLDPETFEPGAAESATAPVYGDVRARADRLTDVRLLVDDGQHHRELAMALARNLGCDVYLTPDGAVVRYVRESSAMAGDAWDAIAVDRETGEPVAWSVVRPAQLPAGVPTWFTTIRGRLRQSGGLVSVALPDGIAFATKNTFRDATYLATHLRTGTSRITTVAVNADLGRFEISRFDDTGSLLGGVELATLVSASLDLIHPDVLLALTWPTDTAACAALDTELMRFADALNRTVWVPQPQGAAFVLSGCGEFAAVDEVGGPSVWRPYPSRLQPQWEPRFGTDSDGRLLPRGEIVATGFPGAPLVSVPPAQLDRIGPWYASVAPSPDLFGLDLAALPDGRLGVLLDTGTTVAVGPRELRTLLRAAGWTGEDLVLLGRPDATARATAYAHLRSLADHLTVDIWVPAPDAQLWTQPDGRLGAATSDGHRGWDVVGYNRPAILTDHDPLNLPAGLVTAPRPAVDGYLRPATPVVVDAPPVRSAVATREPVPAVVAVAGPVAEPVLEGTVVIEPVGVTLPRLRGAGAPHEITWLPDAPVVNRRALELYLWTPLATDQIEAWGLPSADLFLLAGQDPLRLSDHRRDGYLLRVQAPEETAVDLVEHLRDAPAAVRERLVAAGTTHLLPLAWLSELRVTARFDLDGRGGITARTDLDPAALAIRFEGAEHGVPGLPNGAVPWPEKATPSYLMLPDAADGDVRADRRGFVALSRRKPTLLEGHCLYEVKVRKGRAIDVPATLDQLGGLPVVGRMHDFVGLDVLVPVTDLDQAVVARVWRPGPTGKPVMERLTGATLADTLAA